MVTSVAYWDAGAQNARAGDGQAKPNPIDCVRLPGSLMGELECPKGIAFDYPLLSVERLWKGL